MARSRDGEVPLPPEVMVLNEDGLPVGNAGQAVALAERRGSTGMRFGALVVIVAVFAFGVVTGRSTIQIRTGAATAATVPPIPTQEPADAASETSAERLSKAQTGPAAADVGQSEAASQTFPELTGSCDHSMYIAQVGYVTPLTTPIDVTIVAGSPPRSFDLRSGTAGPPLATLARGEFVSEIAVDDDGTVLAVRSCDNPMVPKILRVTGSGETIPIEMPSDARPGTTFVTVDNRIWVTVSYRAYDQKNELLATDGSGDTKDMPPVIDSNPTVVSPDGSRSASVELNTDGPAGRHIQITDMATGETTALPGIRLGAAGADLAFSPDSRWLVVAVATLAGGRILLYGPDDLRGPYGLPGTVSEPRVGRIPVAVY